MHAENVIATPIQLRPAQYLSPREQHLLFEAVEARLHGLPTLVFSVNYFFPSTTIKIPVS
jgi:hypothetical protein